MCQSEMSFLNWKQVVAIVLYNTLPFQHFLSIAYLTSTVVKDQINTKSKIYVNLVKLISLDECLIEMIWSYLSKL